MNPFSEYATIIGIDWADHKHDLCLVKSETGNQGNQDTHPLTLLPKAGNIENINRTTWKRISHAQAPKSPHQSG